MKLLLLLIIALALTPTAYAAKAKAKEYHDVCRIGFSDEYCKGLLKKGDVMTGVHATFAARYCDTDYAIVQYEEFEISNSIEYTCIYNGKKIKELRLMKN